MSACRQVSSTSLNLFSTSPPSPSWKLPDYKQAIACRLFHLCIIKQNPLTDFNTVVTTYNILCRVNSSVRSGHMPWCPASCTQELCLCFDHCIIVRNVLQDRHWERKESVILCSLFSKLLTHL